MDERNTTRETATDAGASGDKQPKQRRAEIAFAPGMRVRLNGTPVKTTLTSSFGSIVAVEEWGTAIVYLDSPATFHNDDGTARQLDEIRVLTFNLAPIK